MRNPFLIIGFLILIIIHLLILKSITYTAWPEMFSYPYLLNNGFLLYKDIAHPYVPLLTFILALYYKLAGTSLLSGQIFTWVLIGLNDLLIFLISIKILNKRRALIPVLIYVLLQPVLEGNMLWFDLATIPFILGSFLVFLTIKNQQKKLFWFGLALALALLVKQQIVILSGLIFLVLLFTKQTRKSLHYFILGSLIPITITFLILLIQGVFKDYIFWTLEFPLVWLPKFPGYSDLPGLKDTLLLLILFAVPSVYLLSKILRGVIFPKIIFVSIIAAVLTAFPRFSFFHLQPAIAVLMIFYALILKENKKVLLFFLLPVLFYCLILWKDYKPFIGVENARFYDNEEVKIANFINENTSPVDSIYFLGPHSLLYVISAHLPPKPWIENFIWHFEIPGMQEKEIKAFENEKNLVIFKDGALSGNWYDLGVYQPKLIIDYINKNFNLVNKSEGGLEVWKRK